MRIIKADHHRLLELAGVPKPVSRPVDIDPLPTGFSSLRSLRIYCFEAGSVIDGHAEEDEVLIVEQPVALSAMVATPLIGLLSDKIGKRAFMMMFASILLMPVYLLMGFTNVTLFLPLCMMGVAFSVIPAVMWPSVAYIVEPKRLGTAFALMTLIEQSGSSR